MITAMPKAEEGAPGDVKRKAASEPSKEKGAAEGGFILEDF
jgi:hypothetical protein